MHPAASSHGVARPGTGGTRPPQSLTGRGGLPGQPPPGRGGPPSTSGPSAGSSSPPARSDTSLAAAATFAPTCPWPRTEEYGGYDKGTALGRFISRVRFLCGGETRESAQKIVARVAAGGMPMPPPRASPLPAPAFRRATPPRTLSLVGLSRLLPSQRVRRQLRGGRDKRTGGERAYSSRDALATGRPARPGVRASYLTPPPPPPPLLMRDGRPAPRAATLRLSLSLSLTHTHTRPSTLPLSRSSWTASRPPSRPPSARWPATSQTAPSPARSAGAGSAARRRPRRPPRRASTASSAWQPRCGGTGA